MANGPQRMDCGVWTVAANYGQRAATGGRLADRGSQTTPRGPRLPDRASRHTDEGPLNRYQAPNTFARRLSACTVPPIHIAARASVSIVPAASPGVADGGRAAESAKASTTASV
jgi:hypothetical protein